MPTQRASQDATSTTSISLAAQQAGTKLFFVASPSVTAVISHTNCSEQWYCSYLNVKEWFCTSSSRAAKNSNSNKFACYVQRYGREAPIVHGLSSPAISLRDRKNARTRRYGCKRGQADNYVSFILKKQVQ
ncbi:hypothetical protein AVEN_85518-1 [Araneus ventricosus]|uniref:Uncharacterized protein n=1 Tax=Araneus ventricosus TaxID=182803 RepID=A0A4Y2KEW4_ARAVE|nr:hypothetical protein AVEN_85518-1 [Araneus ventricosus]